MPMKTLGAMLLLCVAPNQILGDDNITEAHRLPQFFDSFDESQPDLAMSRTEILELIDSRVGEAVSGGRSASAQRTDAAVINHGSIAFQNACTACHGADRATNRSKTKSAWVRTIRRMADKPGAEIQPHHVEPIAAFLASRSHAAPGENSASVPANSMPDFDLHATLAPSVRAGHRGDVLENSGFLPEAWIGANWQPNEIVNVRASACVTCHRGNEQGSPIELAEAAITFDVLSACSYACDDFELNIEAGRFLVPFGTASERSHPGAARFVTPALPFNMGQLAHRRDIGAAVLPMPYADEGARIISSAQVTDDISITLDTYVVNGLQGNNGGINFFDSREYQDNNAEPAVGGRATIGTQFLRLGGSAMSGRHNDEFPGAADISLNYKIAGADVLLRPHDRVRVLGEIVIRNSDIMAMGDRRDEEVLGWSVEGEIKLLEDSELYLIGRWDSLDRRSDRTPPGSSLATPVFAVERFTWGIRMGLPGGSTILANMEHWTMPEQLGNVDVFGLKWIISL